MNIDVGIEHTEHTGCWSPQGPVGRHQPTSAVTCRLHFYIQTHESFTKPTRVCLPGEVAPPSTTQTVTHFTRPLSPSLGLRNSPWCPLAFHPRGHSSMTECFSKSWGKCYTHVPRAACYHSGSVGGGACKSCISSNEQMKKHILHFLLVTAHIFLSFSSKTSAGVDAILYFCISNEQINSFPPSVPKQFTPRHSTFQFLPIDCFIFLDHWFVWLQRFHLLLAAWCQHYLLLQTACF